MRPMLHIGRGKKIISEFSKGRSKKCKITMCQSMLSLSEEKLTIFNRSRDATESRRLRNVKH